MATGTFYLNATGTLGGDGTGRNAQNPVNCSTQALLDAWYAANLNNDSSPGTLNIIYSAGTFQTQGWLFNSREMVYTGNHHIGNGIDSTILKLVGASSVTADGVIFSRDQPATVNNWSCNGITFDCNATNQPKWVSNPGAVNAIITPAGSNIVIQNCKFINWGTSALGREAFPVAIQGASGQTNFLMQDCLIDSCIFSNPVSGNKDGTTVASIYGLPSGNVTMDASNVISNCQFINCWNATANQPGDFTYQHCVGAPTVRNNQCTGCDVFYYQEPAALALFDALVEGNDTACRRLLYTLFHAASGIGKITCRNNRIIMPVDNSSNSGFQVTGGGINLSPRAFSGNIEIYGNYFQAGGVNHFGVTINENTGNGMYIPSALIYSNTFQHFTRGQEINIDKRIDTLAAYTLRDNIIE